MCIGGKYAKKNMLRCTMETCGTVSQIKDKGIDFPTMVTVQYEVNNKIYEVTESKKYKNEFTRVGFLPVGQRRIPKLGNVILGSIVRVSYNPDVPSESFLPDNVGKVNV